MSPNTNANNGNDYQIGNKYVEASESLVETSKMTESVILKHSNVQKRTEAVTKVIFMFVCQIFLISFVALEVTQPDQSGDIPQKGVIVNPSIVLARFVCGVVLHLLLQPELSQGMSMMKYALNHPWKFVSYR